LCPQYLKNHIASRSKPSQFCQPTIRNYGGYAPKPPVKNLSWIFKVEKSIAEEIWGSYHKN
jgi:hypothetical protein